MSYVPSDHAASHIQGGSDEVDFDLVNFPITATNVTPNTTGTGVHANDFASWVEGVDDRLTSPLGGTSVEYLEDATISGYVTAAYPLDEPSGYIYRDIKGGANIGESGTVTTADGPDATNIPYASSFDGSASTIRAVTARPWIDVSGDWSMTAWFKLVDTSGLQTIASEWISGNLSWWIGTSGANLHLYWSSNGSAFANTSVDSVSTATWHLAYFGFDSGTGVEAELDASGTKTTETTYTTMHESTNVFSIGADGGIASQFEGEIAQVCFYDSLLSTAQTSHIYNSIAGRKIAVTT